MSGREIGEIGGSSRGVYIRSILQQRKGSKWLSVLIKGDMKVG